MLETLQVIWFILWALLWAVYFVLDGFDLGLGSLLPFIGSNEEERRIMYNAAGPFWDGNEVWLISAGGVTFAAFPKVYAVMFSALYAPLLILLFALIFRAVSFEFRGKVGKSIEDKTDKNGVPYCQFSAFSAEKVQDGFEYIWVSFFLFDGKCEAWLQPGVKANIKGALSVSVFNDKLDFSCRVSEMSEYVPQPYNG
jgi:hypothetical protein